MKSVIKPLTRRPAWKALAEHYKEMRNRHLRDLFADAHHVVRTNRGRNRARIACCPPPAPVHSVKRFNAVASGPGLFGPTSAIESCTQADELRGCVRCAKCRLDNSPVPRANQYRIACHIHSIDR